MYKKVAIQSIYTPINARRIKRTTLSAHENMPFLLKHTSMLHQLQQGTVTPPTRSDECVPWCVWCITLEEHNRKGFPRIQQASVHNTSIGIHQRTTVYRADLKAGCRHNASHVAAGSDKTRAIAFRAFRGACWRRNGLGCRISHPSVVVLGCSPSGAATSVLWQKGK